MDHEQLELPFDEAPKDPFADETPLKCGVDNPDYCESCQ